MLNSLSENLYLTATTTANPCDTPVLIGTSSIVYPTSTGSSSYIYRYVAWPSSSTGTVNLVFQFQNNPDEWYMDDVSVSDGTAELLLNGGFESGSFSPGWTKIILNGGCNMFRAGAAIDTSYCRTGNRCFSDECGGHTDQISQPFSIIAGQI